MITVAMHHPGGRSESFQTAYTIKQKNEAIRYRCVSNDCNMDEEQCEVQRKTAALVYLPMPLLSSSKDLNAGIIIFSVQ